MKPSFSSVLVLAVLFHIPCLVLGAPWRNRHAYYVRSVEPSANTTAKAEILTTTTLAKAKETALFANSTTIAKQKATATKTKEESTASTTIIKGKSPLQTALLPRITDWNSCQSFLSNSGINLFVNQVNLNFDVVINQVTVFEILIDERGRARETRVRHAFPQPTNYYVEFDKSKNKSGNNKGNKGKAGAAKPTITATAGKAKETAAETTTKAKETTTTTTAGKAEATASETAKKVEETASTTTTTAAAKETATESASTTAAAEESAAATKESAVAEATAMY